jgi:hypothetical protein
LVPDVVTAMETPIDGGSVRGVTDNASHAGTDRVAERRRAVALARHYRELEGLTIEQIADRLGRSPATVKAYFYDPTGEKARAVKARYVGVFVAVARTRSRATGKETLTRTARPAIQARSSGGGPGSPWWPRCASGRPARDGCPRRMTGRERTLAGAGEMRLSVWPAENGRRRAT